MYSCGVGPRIHVRFSSIGDGLNWKLLQIAHHSTLSTFSLQKPVGGVAVMPFGADLLSKFRKDKGKDKEDAAKELPVEVSILY